MLKPSGFVLGLLLGLGVCLGIAKACEAPPGGPSRDSLAIIAARDSIHRSRDSITALLAAIDSGSAAHGALALAYSDSLRRARHGAALPPRPGPGPADSVLPLWIRRSDSLEILLYTAASEADSAASAARSYREAYRGAVQTAGIALHQLIYAEGKLNQAAVTIGKLEADVRKARGADRIRLGVGADLHLVPGVLTAVGGVQVITRRRLWLGGELEASAVGGFGVAATSADSVRTGLGMAAQVAITF